MKIPVFAAVLLMLLASASSQASSWRGIVPLKSTRADVERLLGKPNGLGRYEFDTEFAYIYYSSTRCNDPDDCECLVPNDTVLHVSVTPQVQLNFSKLKIHKKQFTKTRSTHLPTVVSYSNQVQGIIYTVDEDKVTGITYVPSQKDCRQLLRENAPPKPKLIRANISFANYTLA